MSQGLSLDYENIAAHMSDYIQKESFFTTFEIEDIQNILKHSNLTTNDFVTLLKQASAIITANDIYI